MAFMWYPGQDVDFMSRLSKVEKATKILFKLLSIDENKLDKILSFSELEQENQSLNERISDLEEDLISLNEEITKLHSKM